MLRKDGTWTIYIVEVLSDKEWRKSDTYFMTRIPQRLIYKNPDGYDSIELEPFESFSSSGKCWQETGINGSYEYEIAVQLFALLVKYNPDRKFRLVELEVYQKRTVLMTGEQNVPD